MDGKQPCGNLISCCLKPEWGQMLLMFFGDTWGMPVLWVATKALLKIVGMLLALHLGSEGKWNIYLLSKNRPCCLRRG